MIELVVIVGIAVVGLRVYMTVIEVRDELAGPVRSAADAFTSAIDDFATRHDAARTEGRARARIFGVLVEASVVAIDDRWYAQLAATIDGPLGPEVNREHRWRGRRIPALPRSPSSQPIPTLDAAWGDIVVLDAPVAIVCDGRKVTAWIDRPLTGAALGRVAIAVAAIARWDAGYATVLTALPDAKLVDDVELSPAVGLAPDDLRLGLRDGRTVARAEGATAPAGTPTTIAGGELASYDGGVEIVWPGVERDRERLVAAISALRGLRAATGPYR